MTAPPFDVEALRREFPALSTQDGRWPTAFFDGPGATQVPKQVSRAMSEYLESYNANSGGVFPASIETEAMVAKTRSAYADFLGGAVRGRDSFRTEYDVADFGREPGHRGQPPRGGSCGRHHPRP